MLFFRCWFIWHFASAITVFRVWLNISDLDYANGLKFRRSVFIRFIFREWVSNSAACSIHNLSIFRIINSDLRAVNNKKIGRTVFLIWMYALSFTKTLFFVNLIFWENVFKLSNASIPKNNCFILSQNVNRYDNWNYNII